MDDLQKVLENRLAALRDEPQKWQVRSKQGKLIELNDTSIAHITESWKQAGFLDKEGHRVNLVEPSDAKDRRRKNTFSSAHQDQLAPGAVVNVELVAL